jgi:NADH-quinone oxidoreductase subunit E
MPVSFPQKTLEEIEELRREYPESRSVLIPVLKLAQEEFGHLSAEVMSYVGELLEVPASVVAGVATFYHNFFTASHGTHVIQICRTLSCHLAGAAEVSRRFREILNIESGGTTEDGLITLREVECLAACGSAPAVIIDGDYFEGFEVGRCQQVVDDLRAGRRPEGGAGVPGGEVAGAGERT